MSRFIFIGFERLKFWRDFPPFYPLFPFLISEVLNFLDGHDSDFLNVMIDLIKVEGLFLDFDSFLMSDWSEEILKLFGPIIRVNDSVSVLVNEIHFMVSAVEDELLF